MPKHRPAYLPYVALIIGILCLGFSALFVRWANAPGVISSFYRMGIAAAVVAIPFARSRQANGKLPTRGVALALLSGLFFGVDMAFWSQGIMISGATNPTLMANTAPAWVGLGAFLLFGERRTGRFWLGLGLSIAGAALILGMDRLQDFSLGLGTLYGLIAGLFYGGFFLVAQRGRIHMDTLSFFWLSVLGSTILLLGVGAAMRLSFIDYPWQSFMWFLAAGLITQVAGWFAINYAQGYLPATIISQTMLGQPVMTAVLAILLLNENLTIWQLIGGTAILGGILLVHRSPGIKVEIKKSQIEDPYFEL